jgi:hypothetical protein
MIDGYPLVSSNLAMENPPFIDDFPRLYYITWICLKGSPSHGGFPHGEKKTPTQQT